MSITAELIASVQALSVEGKKAGTIAMMLKIKKADVEGILAGTVVAGEDALVVEPKVEGAEVEVKAPVGETSALMDQLKAQQAAVAAQAGADTPKKERKSRSTTTLVKVKASSSKDAEGNSIQRRNTNCDTRAVAAFYSPKLNMCWIGTHLGFATKTPEGAMKIMRTAPQKALDPLKTADDVIMVVEAVNVPVGPELEAAKMVAYEKYDAQKMIMLCRRPKTEAAPQVTEQPAPTEIVPEQVAVETVEEVVAPEQDVEQEAQA